MTREMVQTRLEAAQAKHREFLQQRARVAELLEQTTAQLNASQGRIAELTELLALMETT